MSELPAEGSLWDLDGREPDRRGGVVMRPRGLRRRPLLFLIRYYVGGAIITVGNAIEGDYRYETIGGPDFDGEYEARPVPASWEVSP